MELEKLPKTIVFVGGGFISFEFAHIAARTGSEVHIVHRGKQPLEAFDTQLVQLLLEKATDIGINVHLNAEVQSVEKTNTGFTVTANSEGNLENITGDLVVHGAGRVPNIDDMNLEKGNIERTKKGIHVNAFPAKLE